MIEQSSDSPHVQPWILDEHGHEMPGHDHTQRILEMKAGLTRHSCVITQQADASSEDVERVLGMLHHPSYLQALRDVDSIAPTLMADFAAPGLAPDTPVSTGIATIAIEGVRTAVTAAQRVLAGSRFVYALCRPPGHHAGPSWLGGCCYLNNAAAAAQTLVKSEGGGSESHVGILDLDIHYPNGTSAIAERMSTTSLYSLHSTPVVNSPTRSAQPRTNREHVTEFSIAPTDCQYLDAVAASIDSLAESADALVLSLGYDTVAGDPHGCWSFSSEIFTDIGRLLRASQLPICVVQEGGYALDSLAPCSYAFASGLLGSEQT